METVEVLVRIPKKDFEELQSNYVWWGKYGEYIKNGTILPKGHGKLIAEPTKEDITKTIGGQNDFAEFIREAVKAVFDNAPTIIDADKDDEGMSVENGKVCCNCRHNIRKWDEYDDCYCWCEVENEKMGYARVMTGWCRHWAKDNDMMEWFKKWAKEVSE